MRLQVEYVPIERIKPYEMNAKLHPAEQVEQIKRSIKEFGFNDPIAVWNDTIVEGHGRLIAAEELGLDKLPIIRLDGLTDEQRRAYTLVHNKLTMNTGFDLELLQMELDSIESINMNEYGFETRESIQRDLDEFFNGADELPENVELMHVRFIITPDEEQYEGLIKFLDESGLEYEEA